MSNRKITVKDLAQLCGVSIGTIDRAINNRGGINPETKQKILDAAAKYGYVKNQNARTLSSGSSNLIGVIIFNLKNEFPSALLTSIEAEASRRGYSTLIMLSNYSEKTECDCVTRMRSMNVAGIIAMSVVTDSGYYESLIHGGTRIVAVGNRIVGDIPYVGIDDRAAMRASTEYVLARGYERLVYVAPLLEKAATQNIGAQSERFSGFLDAIGLTEAKLDSTGAGFNAARVEYEVIDRYDSYERRIAECAKSPRRTAFICPSDTYTVKCLPTLERGCGVIGFDRLGIIGSLIPELSGIAYPTEDIGRLAVDCLLDGGQGQILPYELIFGKTV